MISPGSQGLARFIVAGLVILLLLLAQVGGVFGAAPHRATLAGEIQTAAAQAARPNQPVSCAEHDDATCCITGQCENIAGSPVYLPATEPDAVASLTRYASAAEAHDNGYAARPTLPPPRRGV